MGSWSGKTRVPGWYYTERNIATMISEARAGPARRVPQLGTRILVIPRPGAIFNDLEGEDIAAGRILAHRKAAAAKTPDNFWANISTKTWRQEKLDNWRRGGRFGIYSVILVTVITQKQSQNYQFCLIRGSHKEVIQTGNT
jgi:hypothetical protein